VFPAWTWIVGFFLGATAGSFLNVVIYRTPRNISLSNPKHSFCPNCEHRLDVLDLFPLFSFLISRGKCRHCSKPVSSRYFFVEVMTGSIWAGLWWQYFVVGGDPARFICYALAASTLVAIIYIDWELYIIPDSVNAFLLFVGLGYNGWLYYKHDRLATIQGWPSSVIGALVGIAVLWGIAFLGRIVFRKDAMGHGDIKMARGIGAVLLPATAIMSFGLAVALGAVLGIVQVLALRGKAETTDGVDGTEGEDLEPESIGSLLQSGLGYILCIDIIGLALPKLYKAWFHEDAYLPFEEVTDFEVERTMIPFGPYLALGAIVATVFQAQILGGVSAYWNWATGGGAAHLGQLCLEQFRLLPSQ
jgi:leader peptidase (prepilin peptidase)/N-methyltransferase